MRKNFLLLAMLAMAVFSCLKNEKQAELRFCADILPNEPCAGEDTIFSRGRVWAQLLIKPEFKDTAVIGKLYGFKNGERVFIESKVHEVDEDEKIIMEVLYMSASGNYEVEFFDTRGNLLARKGFEIW